MRVKINEDLSLTKTYHGVTPQMIEMVGKIYTVKNETDTDYVIYCWLFDKRDCTIVDDYELVDNNKLEDLNSFVIDLSTTERVYYELESIIHDIQDRVDIYKTMTIEEMREFILEYYATTYKDDYIMWVAPNTYRIVEEDLFVKRG